MIHYLAAFLLKYLNSSIKITNDPNSTSKNGSSDRIVVEVGIELPIKKLLIFEKE